MTPRAPITTIKTIVRAIDEVGPATKRFVLADPDEWELPPARAGAHIDLHLGEGLTRTYSLCNDPVRCDRYVVAVKREAAGRGGSRFLHDEVRIGDTIGVSLPRGGLPLGKPDEHHIFVAGGIGVTPFLSAAAFLSRRGQASFQLHLFTRGTPPLADMLAPLSAAGRLHLHDTSRSPRPDLVDLIGAPRPGIRVACCGPQGMIEAFERAAECWPQEQVHIERFVPLPVAADPAARAYRLVLARSKRETDVSASETMLSAIQRCGAVVPVSCGGGICGACKVTWIEGSPLHRDRCLTPREREAHLAACVAGSVGERLVLDL